MTIEAAISALEAEWLPNPTILGIVPARKGSGQQVIAVVVDPAVVETIQLPKSKGGFEVVVEAGRGLTP